MKHAHIFNFVLILALLVSLQSTLAAFTPARSVLSWLQGDDETKTEETIIPGYRPFLEVHKYNGVQINPIHGGPPQYFLSSDQEIVNLLYRAAPFLPEESRLHEFEFGPLQPYLQMIPDDSIDRLRLTLESEGEERIGSSAKSKLLKFLQIVKEKKLKPIKDLFEKKKNLVQSALNYLHPPPPPPPPHHPPSVHIYPPPPPPPADTLIVPAGPSVFALPPPAVFVNEIPPPPAIHFLPPPPPPSLQPEFLVPKFTLPNHTPEFSAIRQTAFFQHPVAHEFHENAFGTAKKDLCEPQDKCGGTQSSFPKKNFNTSGPDGPLFHSISLDQVLPARVPVSFITPSPPPPVPLHEAHFFPSQHPIFTTPVRSIEGDSALLPPVHFFPDLLSAASENEESSQVNSAVPINVVPVEERNSVPQTPTSPTSTLSTSTTPVPTTASTLQSLKSKYTQNN